MFNHVRSMRGTIGWLALVTVIVIGFGGLGAQHATVSAHALFLWGVPDNGPVVSTAPAQLDAYFAEDIVRQSGTYGLKVTDSNGNEVDNQDTVIDDNNRRHMTVTLQSGLGADTYNV